MARPKKPTAEQQQVEQIIPYLQAGKEAGCPPDQMMNLTKAGMILQPKQLDMSAAARQCDYRCPACEELHAKGQKTKKDCTDCGPVVIGVGGARGGGKSAWLAAQVMLDDCQRRPGLKFLYLRKTAKSLREQIRDLLKKTFPTHSASNPMYNYREQFGEIKFPNGSFIMIGHFKDESEIDNYIGNEYDGIAIEELTTLTASKWENLCSCLRSSKTDWRPRAYAAWNWGGIGHSWVKQLFYDPWKEKRQIKTRYILALVIDNHHNNPEYVHTLESYVGWKYQSWYLGDPDFAAGNFFTNYREDIHVYPNEITTLHPSEITRWFGSMDYGSSHPNCFHLHCETENGDIFTVGECHTMGETIADNCAQFGDLCRLNNVEVFELDAVFSGQDVKRTDRKTREDGSTIETEFSENNVKLTPIHINRVNAFSQMQERMGNVSRGIRPSWFIHKSCIYLRAQIQCAQCDPKKPNDIIKQNVDVASGTDAGGDDALECLTGDALVITSNGEVPLMEIKVGDFVLTREGFKKVLVSMKTRINASVFEVCFSNNSVLIGTGNHRIFSPSLGWIRIDSLAHGCDILGCENYSQQLMSKNSKASDTIAIQMPNKETGDAILSHQPIIGSEDSACFTGKSGSPKMEIFQKVWKFIIRTKILSIIPLKIWSALRGENTMRFISRKGMSFIKNGAMKNSAHRDFQNPDREALSSSRALYAVKRTLGKTILSGREISALEVATTGGIGIVAGRTLKENASIATGNLWSINGQKPVFAPCHVLTIRTGINTDVYNLTVEDCPEFFANGILTHNCARNGIVGAYSSLLSEAKPLKMGNHQSMLEQGEEPEYVDVETQIRQIEEQSLESEQSIFNP